MAFVAFRFYFFILFFLFFLMIRGLSWAAVLDCVSDFCPPRLESGAEKVAIEKKLTGKEL